MARIGTFLLWTPLVILSTAVILVLLTNIGFVMEAKERGFDAPINSNGCWTNGTKTFCKEDYGFLGIKTWMDVKDRNAIYSLFDKNSIPSDICKERVISYDLEKTNDTTTLHVKCNS